MRIDPIKSEVILCCVERCAGWLAKLTREKEKRAKRNGWPFQRHRPNRLLRITNFCQSHLKIAFFRFQTIQAKIQLQFYFHSYILRSSKLTSSSVTERRDRTNNAIILVINWTTFFYSFSFEWFVRVFWFEWVAIQKERWTTLQFENAPNEQKLNDIYCNHVQYKKRRSKEWPFLCLYLSLCCSSVVCLHSELIQAHVYFRFGSSFGRLFLIKRVHLKHFSLESTRTTLTACKATHRTFHAYLMCTRCSVQHSSYWCCV